MPANDDLFISDGSPARADARKNRALLLTTAQRLFAERGVNEVSMTAIAEEAGVGKGTLYRHFENKADLCYALLDEDQRNLQNETLRRMREDPDAEANLRWVVGAALQFVVRNAELLAVEPTDRDHTPSLEHPSQAWQRRTLVGLLMQNGAAGDVDYLADTLYVMLDVRTVTFQMRTLGYGVARIEDGLNALIDRVLGGGRPRE